MALRAVHNRLVEEFGIPQWGSYVIFAFATIILGALLGLLIVCLIDLVFPAKVAPIVPEPSSRDQQSTPGSSSAGEEKDKKKEGGDKVDETKKDI